MAQSILLTRGLVAIVDDEDYEALSPYRWRVLGRAGRWYAYRQWREGGMRRHLSMSRLIVGAQRGQIVDHVNRDTLDNRRSNLRIVTRSANALNRDVYASNTSGYVGVSWHTQRSKWEARFWCDGRCYSLGLFATAEAAARARDAKALELAPSYAALNFGRNS